MPQISGRIYARLYSFATRCAQNVNLLRVFLWAQSLLNCAASPNFYFLFEKEYSDMPENGSINEPTTGTTGATAGTTGNTATGTATALSQTAHDYGQKISDAASQA